MGHHQFPVYFALVLFFSPLLYPHPYCTCSLILRNGFGCAGVCKYCIAISHHLLGFIVDSFHRIAKTNPTERALMRNFHAESYQSLKSYTFVKRELCVCVYETCACTFQSERVREREREIVVWRITRISFRDDVKSNKADSRNTLR